MTARLSPSVAAGKLSYYRRWYAQHVAEAAVMVPRGWVWSVGLLAWVPARKVSQ